MRSVAICKFILIVLLVSLPTPTLAIPAITCHCFTERSYEPARPAAADPYLLATTQNSFFAVVFNADKKAIVLKKQSGVSSDDLWVAYWIASKSGVSPDVLLEAKKSRDVWKDALSAQQLSSKNMGERFTSAVKAKASSAHLAEKIVDELFLRHQLLPDAELAAMRQAGATNQELIIATVIAAGTKQSPRTLLIEVRSGSQSWGALLKAANIDTKNIQAEIYGMLKNAPR